MHVGNWQLDTVNGGMFRLDGGVMFGIVPKALWGNVTPADDENRIRVANHCVLARDGKHTVLIDTGYGGKYDKLDRKFYSMEPGEPLVQSLRTLGIEPEEIDTVVLSHLHFDHVGGATQTGPGGELTLTFPNARHFVGRQEWEDATSQKAELRKAYPLKEIIPLQPVVSLIEDDDEVVPGLRAKLTGGHTQGHLSFVLESCGEEAIYPGDICPSRAHLRTMWHLAYDTHPLDTRRRKPQLLNEASQRNSWILWNHDPDVAVSRVTAHPRREFVPTDSAARL